MSRSPEVRLSATDSVLRAVADMFIYIACPRQVLTFRQYLGYWPRPALPQRYHEKYLWRKLFDHDPRHVELSDKLAAKAHVARHWPEVRVPALFWEGDDPAQIPDAVLAGDCAIKANHGSGMNLFVRDGAVDRAELTAKARRWMRRTFGRRHGEWAYGRIAPRLFAEQLLIENGALVSPNYRFYVAGGRCFYVYALYPPDPGEELEAAFDRDGRPRAVLMDTGKMGTALERPADWQRMVETAERMGAEFDLVRVDLYAFAGAIWFSEFTFYSVAGYAWIDDAELIAALNRRWDIRRSWFLSTPQTGIAGLYARLLRSWLATAERTAEDAGGGESPTRPSADAPSCGSGES